MYFGVELIAARVARGVDGDVPVGLIQSAIGGSQIESWMDNRTLATALYWTSTMFLLESMWTVFSAGKVGRETVHQLTNYEIRVVKPPRAATHLQ